MIKPRRQIAAINNPVMRPCDVLAGWAFFGQIRNQGPVLQPNGCGRPAGTPSAEFP